LIGFLNSPFFSGLVTLAVGTFAYVVYQKQKHDEKQRAAAVILLEIEEAEQQLAKVDTDKPFAAVNSEDVRLMPVSSWNQYKHLFTHDFDRNETDKISDFYARCAAYDCAAALSESIIFERSQQELRINMQRVLADYAREYSDKIETALQADLPKLEQDYIERRRRFVEIYGNTATTHMYTYVPVKPENDAARALRSLETSLSLTSVGIKIKAIAHQNHLFSKKPKK